MPELDLYSIFISHAWSHDEEYEHLVNLLNQAPLFKWRNYSVPRDRPVVAPDIRAGKRLLVQELDQQIRPANCVLIIAGMYIPHKEWIQKEIKLTQKYAKPIVSIVPRGNQRVPKLVEKVASAIVAWETESIVQAIRRCAS